MKANRYLYLLLLACVCSCVQVNAQATCPGSALAPVFQQTFGTSAASTSKNVVPAGFITNYAFNGSGALADGQYMVTPLVQNAGKNDWAVGGDHTGDVNGNMFLVNAGTGASLFFKQQVNNLCPGSTFSFSAWLANVNTASLTLPICGASIVYPNVTFYIKDVNGNVLQSFNTGNVPLTSGTNVAPNWKQYGFQFALPAGITSLVLEMVDSYGGQPQCGNDLAIDDIVFSACTPQVSIAFNTASAICAGSSTTINSALLNSPFVSPAYQWQRSTNGGLLWSNVGSPSTNANDLTLTHVGFMDNAMYRVLVGPDIASLSSSTCTTTSNYISLTVNPLPQVSIGSNNILCETGALNLAAGVTGGLAPYTYNWAGPNFSSTNEQPVISNLTNTANAGTYVLTATDANGCSAAANQAFSFSQLPSAAHAGAGQSLCNTTAVTLNGNAPALGAGNWTQVSGPNTATIQSPTLRNTQVTNLVPGTYRFRWSIELSPCTTSADEVEIVIAAPTVGGILAGTPAVCTGSNSGNVVLTGNTGNVSGWESSTDNGNTWSAISQTTNNLTYTNLTQTTVYRVLVQSGVCSSGYSAVATVTVSQPTQAGTLSGGVNVCATSNSGTLSVTGLMGNVEQWESSTDNGANWSVINHTNPNYAFSNLTATTLYRALVKNNPCTQQYTNTVTVTVAQAVVPGIVTGSAVVCAASNSGSLSLTGNNGTVQQWESSTDNGNTWSVLAQTANHLSYSNLTGTTAYRVLVVNGNCALQYSNTVVVTADQPTVGGTVTGSLSVCALANSGTVTLTGYTGNILHWETSADNGSTWSQVNSTAGSYGYNNLAAATMFKASVQNGVCPAQYSAAATINTSTPTHAGTVNGSATVCATGNAGIVSLTAYNGSISQWEESTDNGNTWNVIAATNALFYYTNLPVTTTWRALVQSGSCNAVYSDPVTVSVSQATHTGILAGDVNVCASSNSGMISLTGNTGNIIHWETSIDNGNTWGIIANTNNNYAYNNLAATTLFRALIQNGVCAAQYSNNAIITVDQATVAGILAGNAVLCSNTNSGTISLTGNTGNVIQWETSVDNGNSWNLVANTGNSFSYSNLTTTTIYRTLVQNGSCITSYSNNSTITIDQPTVAGVLSGNVAVCASSNSGMISLTGNTGNIIHWETSIDNGNTWSIISNTNNNYAYSNLAATTLFRALIQNGVCASQYSNNVTITVDQATITGALSGNAVLCSNTNSGTISLTGNTGNVIQWETSVDNGNSWSLIANTGNSFSYSNLTTTTIYRTLVQNGSCITSYSNNSTVAIDQPTIAGVLSGNVAVCASSNSGMISLTGNTGNIIHWETSIDNGNTWGIIANTNNNYAYNNLAATTLFRALIQNGVCAAQYSNNAIITVDQATVAGILAGNAVLCSNTNSGTISLTGNTGNVIQWETSVDNGNSWNLVANTGNSFSYSNLTTTTIYRTLVQNGSCITSYSNNSTITIDQPTVAGVLSGNAAVCASSNSGMISLTGNTGNIIHWETSIDNGNTWGIIANTNNNYAYNNLSATTLFRALVQNGVCASQYSNSVTIHVDQPTIAGSVTGNATVCVAGNNGSVSVSGFNGTVLQWESSAGNGAAWLVQQHTHTVFAYRDLSENTQFRALVKNGVCPAVYTNTAAVVVAPQVSRATAGAAQTLCSTTHIQLAGNSPVNGTGWWTLVSGPSTVQFSNAALPNATVGNVTAGTYYFEWRISNGVCGDSKDTVAVVVYPLLSNQTDTATQVICQGKTMTINGSTATGGNNIYQYEWQKSPDATTWTTIPGAHEIAYSFTADASFFIRRTVVSQNCRVASGITAIRVLQTISNNSINGNQQVCAGSAIREITGSSPAGGDGLFEYQWQQSTDSGATWTIINGALTKDFSTPTPFSKSTWLRRIVSSQTCSGALANTSNSILIDVKPMAAASLQYKGGTYCSLNTSIGFSAQASHTDSIRWNFGDGTFANTSVQNISHVYRKAGTFVPSAQFTNSAGCNVWVQAKDTIRIDEVKGGFDLTAVYDCGKTTYRFVDTTSSYFPVAQRFWSLNQVNLGGERVLQHSFDTNGANETALQVNTVYGCSTSLQARFDVNIYSYPKVDISAIGQACLNNLMELKSIVNSIDSLKSRVWNLGNGSSATDSVVHVSFFVEGKYVVQLTVSTINSCYDSALKQISIHPIPKIAVKADNMVCKGDSIQLKANGAASYIWKDQDENIVCNNCNSFTISPQKNSQYKVVGYSEFGCSEIAATNVRVVQPVKLIAKTADTLCIGETKKITATGAATYAWRNDAGLSNTNTSSVNVSPLATTTYRVIGKDEFNCFADTADIKITVGSPTPFSVGRDTSILSGVPLQLHASSSPDIRSWQWRGNATFSCLGCIAPVAKVIMDECLTCTATNIYGCKSTDTICITTFCPGSEVFIPNAFSPDGDGINDILFVQGRGIKLVKSFRVFSRWGELVFEKSNFSPGDKSSGWDGRVRGKLASPDVFVYVCEVICEKGIPAVFKGNTAILK